jgi:formylglycine-generating enzyme required for sulfatase activity
MIRASAISGKLSACTRQANMSKSKLRNQIVLTLATLCLVVIPHTTQAANKTKKGQPAKDSPVLMPLQPGSLEPGKVFRDCADCPDMVVIPAGSFDMGSAGSEEKDEKPEHRVTIKQPFAMGKIEITRGQFAAFASAEGYDAGDKCWMLAVDKWEESSGDWRNPGYPQNDSHPVACINWNDAQAYVTWLSLKTGRHYQLPAESQWEYACRAGGLVEEGEQAERREYCGSNNPDNVAWYDHNSGQATHPAASKQANAFGLYDMSGNVGEWMEDSYHNRYNGAPSDGSAWAGNSTKRVLRGGSWLYYQIGARSAFRSASAPEYRYFDTGFRVVRTLP